jgi:hypothetical protein
MSDLPSHYDKSKMGMLPEHLRADGTIKPLSEINEAKLRANRSREIASLIAKREADEKRTPNQKLLADAKTFLKDARFSGQAAKIEFWKSKVDELSDVVAADTAKARRDKEFAGDGRIKIIRDLAEGIKRSGPAMYPNADPVDLDTLVALAESNEWPDPSSQYATFNELMSSIEDREIAMEKQKSEAANMEALKQMVTHTQADVKVAEIQQARAARQVPNAE